MNSSFLAEHAAHGLRVDVLEKILTEHRHGLIRITTFSRVNERIVSVRQGIITGYRMRNDGKTQKLVVTLTRCQKKNGQDWKPSRRHHHVFFAIPEYQVLANGSGTHPLTVFREARSHFRHGERVEFFHQGDPRAAAP